VTEAPAAYDAGIAYHTVDNLAHRSLIKKI
jgi:hypothetical protein